MEKNALEKIFNEHVKMTEHLEAYDKDLKKREKELEEERKQFIYPKTKSSSTPRRNRYDSLILGLVKRKFAQSIT